MGACRASAEALANQGPFSTWKATQATSWRQRPLRTLSVEEKSAKRSRLTGTSLAPPAPGAGGPARQSPSFAL
eukprot:7067522-Lingulodinium_polyedra.AAC.1